ncbi:MAG: GAF and ANTAR domain-containing protein [Candidatus Omnitrophica bacterium]|nr:GAF and ANTAR domain-containing protein [Candidatus Omnitrophota bacterium]
MREKRQLEVLYQISRALVGKQDLEAILQQVVSMTAALIDSKTCSLMLLNAEKDKLVIKATQSLSVAYREKPPIEVGQSVSGKVLEKRQAIQVADVTKDPRYNYPKIAQQEGLKSLLSVPLMMADKAVGVLNCYTEEERVFSRDEIQLVQTVANQAAIMIEHVRLLNEEAESRLALETKKAIGEAKRLLMKKRGMTEEAAHRFIQKTSMERNKPLKEVADAILMAADLENK